MSFVRRAALLGAAVLLTAPPVLAAAPAKPAAATSTFVPSEAAIRAHMGFLASDVMEGREAGTRGYDIAANYVASQYQQLGLKPAGDAGGYLQRVPLLAYRAAGEGSLAVTGADGKATPLVFGEDYLPSAQPGAAETALSAPLVFVGYGVVAPERGRDDYAGLDVAGKIVVVLTGAPRAIQTEERAHYGNVVTKRMEAAKRGAVGLLIVNTPSAEKRRSFDKGIAGYRDWRMTWRDAKGVAYVRGGSAPVLAQISLKGAAKLLAGAPTPAEAILTASETPDGLVRCFPLPARAAVSLKTEIETRESSNVVGLIEGSDPALKAQTVVLSAHLDHIGISEQATGDKINNGALDNASGIATLLEVARGFEIARTKPKRSILLVAVTAEEKGLIGSEYFANNPTVPKASLVADVNLDMPVLLYPFTDVVAFGAERSSIGASVRKAAARSGVALSPDPLPEEGLFTRSDHYRFVEQGVPSVFLMTGFQNGGEKAFTDFLATRYHKPGDDLAQPIDYAAAAKFAQVNYEIARELADTPVKPSWNAGDFFAARFAAPASGAIAR
ncbi:MAG: aminopeptidase [Caulobacter sp.]|nr:aminopeptidase [Caulobacter sp.]